MQALLNIPGNLANPGWVMVAVAAGLLGVAVLILARVRRFQARPLRICFFLSILAHVLLLAVFYLSRVLDMPYIPGSQLTLIVDLSLEEVDGLGESESTTPATEPTPVSPPSLMVSPLPSSAESSTVADSVASQPVATATPQPAPESMGIEDPRATPAGPTEGPMQAPQLLTPPVSQAEPAADATATAAPASDVPEDPISAPAELAPRQRSDGDTADASPVAAAETRDADPARLNTSAANPQVADDRHSVEPVQDETYVDSWSSTGDHEISTQRHSRIPPRYRERVNRPTGDDLKRRGGSPFSEQAVESALQWLANNQSPNGRWDPRRYGAGQGGWIEGQHRGSTGLHADTGITGLALLTFLASGYTHTAGAYQQTVQNGLDFLVASQSAQGNLGGDASIYAQMYCHGIATLAVCEALAISGDETLMPTAERAIAYTMGSQHRGTGGWRYRPGDPGDTSQFGWQLMAIVSAREAGVEIPADVELLMTRFLDSVQSGPAGGLAAYRPGHPASYSMTAEALACRGFLGLQNERRSHEAVQYIMTMKPGTGPRNFYFWYYATMALRQLDADEWTEWNHAMQRELLKTQRHGGPMAGSWDPTTVWGRVGGRVYTTAMATLCLESYYRFAK